MPIRTVRSPLENWRGTSPIQAVLELRAVTDRRDDGGGDLGSDGLDFSDAPARLALDEHPIDLLKGLLAPYQVQCHPQQWRTGAR